MNQDINKIRLIIQKKPYLVWHTKNYNNLSLKSMVEAILNYGDWKDFQELKSIMGIHKLATVFNEISNSNRVNLRMSTIAYFTKYFNKYAQ